jgi:uncharacterized membrane protein
MEYLFFLALPFLAFLGAHTSRKIKVSNRYMIVPPLVSFAVGWAWILFAKYTEMSLAVAQVMFDTTYVLCYFFAFLLLGETVTTLQGIGVGMAVTGIILLSL